MKLRRSEIVDICCKNAGMGGLNVIGFRCVFRVGLDFGVVVRIPPLKPSADPRRS